MKDHTVTIGGVDITKAVVNFSFTKKLNAITTGTVKLKPKELLELPPLNYAAEICLSKSLATGDEILYRGDITSVDVKSDVIEMGIATGVTVHEIVIPGMVVADISHQELVWSITRTAGFDEEHIKVAGFQKWPLEPFELIVPISGIELSKDVSFSKFELTRDPKIVEIVNSISSNTLEDILTEFTQTGLWLRLIVRASTVYDAETEGLRKIGVFLSRLMSRIQLSVSQLGDYQGDWNRNRLFGTPVQGNVVLVRGLTTRRRWLRRPFISSTPIIDVAALPDIDFPPLGYELPLYLTEAFLAWQRSVHANHPIAAITAIWDAIEFYSSQVKVAKSFTKTELKKIREDVVQSLSEADKRKERVVEHIGKLNEASLRMKFGDAMKEDGVTLSDEEWNLLQNLREIRNGFAHGKKVALPTDAEMLLARTAVNRVLVARAFRLTRPTQRDEQELQF